MPKELPIPVTLLIFDLDGTLIDSKEDIARSVNGALERMGFSPIPHDRIADFVGSGVRKLITRALAEVLDREPEPWLLQPTTDAYLEEYSRRLLDSTRLYPDVLDTLNGLAWADLAVVTNKPERFSREILAGLGVGGRFRWILGGDSLPVRKPDPAPLLEVMRRSGTAPRETAMVGDSHIDVRAGKAASVITCGIASGFRGREELQAAGCDIIVDRFADLTECFKPAGV